MTEAENTIFDLELQIRWIRDNEHHQFPGWMNTIMAMEQAVRLINKQNIVRCKDCALSHPWDNDFVLCRNRRISAIYVKPDWYCADGVKKEWIKK